MGDFAMGKQLCYAFMKDLNAKDISLLGNWFNNSSHICLPPAGVIKGDKRISILFKAIFTKYISLAWNVEEVFQLEDNRFVIFSSSTGVFKNKQEYKNRLVTDICFNEDHTIRYLSDYFKDTVVFNARSQAS